ncbi:hypothetical protein OOT46_24580 [Aquabacterium sp. A7-Y]|uniref:hypothetical protein n=1 Tax=Aquabacterium sp. A7-Y TaxID=1349605 RepID=UPI00223D4237|nr:hypothetical protein [Aquabacterium sp. A7-Y]MCW7541003.1 hypothetical protein [Aquabacterium sp. A7-Y]
MNLSKNVTGLTVTAYGVYIDLQGDEITLEKMRTVAQRCAADGVGCNDDCCDGDFKDRLKGVMVEGMDGAVTMHLVGAIKAGEAAKNLARCSCYDLP